ncbi:uncharacterized protein LOC110060102 [Orbicella faveolata]|uniref:uncharacterized protein LOC110060102 n=1 Tax=Orbicella faveolata TaxID=48498 RepID=UPI0009E40D26|nr:uncharacterized protein LOC110060102 [Orbicella faveolata]
MANGYAFVSKNYSSLRGSVFPNTIIIMNHDSSWNCLTERLALIGLIPKDVGGSGDCFFKSVSHQLYGFADLHYDIRTTGIDHLYNYPEFYLESIGNDHWTNYIEQMAKPGTWCDNIIIQAVANAFNCVIHYILPTVVIVKFDDYSGPSISDSIPGCVPICPITVTSQTVDGIHERQQLPLKLAWAITIHKSQGLTLPKAWIDIGQSERTAGISYVAIYFIDEISMVGSGMFNFLNLRLQQIMGTNEPFVGISLVTVGDLFQLKPVFDKWIFENSQSGYDEFATNIWTEYFTLFELTEIMRQKDDKEFAQLLNRLREGNQSEGDISILQQRLLNVRPEQDNYPMNMGHLYTTNASVDAHNNALYTLSKADKAQIKAVDVIVGDISDDLKKQMKNKIPDDPTQTMGLYSLVSVATAAKYDLTTNIDVTDGLTNGAECVIENMDYRVENSTRPSIIWVSFPHPDIDKSVISDYESEEMVIKKLEKELLWRE